VIDSVGSRGGGTKERTRGTPEARLQDQATADSNHTQRIADNLPLRDFAAGAPNKLWTTHVEAVWTLAGWVYLAAIVELLRRTGRWVMSDSNDTKLAMAALDRALLFAIRHLASSTTPTREFASLQTSTSRGSRPRESRAA